MYPREARGRRDDMSWIDRAAAIPGAAAAGAGFASELLLLLPA